MYDPRNIWTPSDTRRKMGARSHERYIGQRAILIGELLTLQSIIIITAHFVNVKFFFSKNMFPLRLQTRNFPVRKAQGQNAEINP